MITNEPTLRQLRYLVALGEEGHFGRAAAACGVSQPALSMQIRRLEELLGVELVERGARGARLTAEGREAMQRAQRIVLDVRDLVDRASQASRGMGVSLALGVIPTIGPYLLPAVLKGLRERYPALEDLRVREAQTAELVQELTAGSLDVALLALPLSEPRVETRELFEDAFVLVVAAGGPSRAEARTEDLDADSLILLNEGHCLRDQALALCGKRTSETRNRFGAMSLSTAVRMVAARHGATLVPEMALEVEVPRGSRLCAVRFRAPEPVRTIGLAWRAGSTRGAHYETLAALVVEAARR